MVPETAAKPSLVMSVSGTCQTVPSHSQDQLRSNSDEAHSENEAIDLSMYRDESMSIMTSFTDDQ